MQIGKNKKIVAGAVVVLAMACAASTAQAQSGSEGGFNVNLGIGNHYNRANLNYETAPIWGTDFGGSWGRLDLTAEMGVSYWWAHEGFAPSNAWQLSAIPMLRWWLGRFYIEGGVGPTVFNKTQFADKTISTAFQFGDQIGFGYQLTRSTRVGLRYSHFSNADIKTPNPGLDVTQLTYTYQF